jgi:hypothetical protein
MSGRPIKQVPLGNGLTLEFWDRSRPTAGDRWYVGIQALVAVPLADQQPEETQRELFRFIRREAGDSICYRHRQERHFVPAGEVEKTRDELVQVFLDNGLRYLSHSDFARQFVQKALREVRAKKDWPAEQVRAVIEALKRTEV